MEPSALIVEQAVAVPLPDGTVLRADVWRPADGGAAPAILMRTPYGRHTHALSAFLDPLVAAARGYATVVQDVRGRGDSGGAFEPFVNEAGDGAATIAWLAAQPWCDGRVVMAGHSYVGATQWLAATRADGALRAIAPVVSSADQGEGWALRNGVREHGFLATWVATSLGDPDQLWLDEPARAYEDRAGLERIAPWSGPWWDDATPPSYWARRSATPARAAVSVPALQVGGWYDAFVSGTLATFAAGSHPGDRLIVGPWGHEHMLPRIVGQHDLGWAGDGQGFGVAEKALDFYDAALAGRPSALAPVTVYVLGARRWASLEAWPPPGARVLEAALAMPGGDAATGGGTDAASAATFVCDPADPTPASGGRGLRMSVPDHGFGPRDQRPLAARADVLALRLGVPRDAVSRHAGAALAGAEGPAAPLILAGPVSATLRVAAEGGATRDWVVTLCVERSDGELWNLCEGIARAAVDADEVTVPLGDTCAELAPGERLVALVAGAAWPRWPRPTTAGTQTVLPGSALALTVAEL